MPTARRRQRNAAEAAVLALAVAAVVALPARADPTHRLTFRVLGGSYRVGEVAGGIGGGELVGTYDQGTSDVVLPEGGASFPETCQEFPVPGYGDVEVCTRIVLHGDAYGHYLDESYGAYAGLAIIDTAIDVEIRLPNVSPDYLCTMPTIELPDVSTENPGGQRFDASGQGTVVKEGFLVEEVRPAEDCPDDLAAGINALLGLETRITSLVLEGELVLEEL